MTRYNLVSLQVESSFVVVYSTAQDTLAQVEPVAKRVYAQCRVTTGGYAAVVERMEKKHLQEFLWAMLADLTNQGWEPLSAAFAGGYERIYLRRGTDE